MTLPRHWAVLAALGLALGGCAEPPAPHTLYVSDETAGVIHVVDGVRLAVDARIPVGQRPRGLGLSPDRRTLYVAVSNDNRLVAVDLRSRRVRVLAAAPDPDRFAVSPDGARLYVVDDDGAAVATVAAADGRPGRRMVVDGEPEGIAVSPDGRWLVCTSEATGQALVIETATGAVTARLPVGARPRDAAFSTDGRRLWISAEQDATVSAFDTRGFARLGAVDLRTDGAPQGTQAVGLAINRAGTRLYVATGRGNRVAEVDAAALKVLRTFDVGVRNWSVALSPDERRLYAANGLSADLTVVDLTSGRTLQTLKLGGRPWGVAVGP